MHTRVTLQLALFWQDFNLWRTFKLLCLYVANSLFEMNFFFQLYVSLPPARRPARWRLRSRDGLLPLAVTMALGLGVPLSPAFHDWSMWIESFVPQTTSWSQTSSANHAKHQRIIWPLNCTPCRLCPPQLCDVRRTAPPSVTRATGVLHTPAYALLNLACALIHLVCALIYLA